MKHLYRFLNFWRDFIKVTLLEIVSSDAYLVTFISFTARPEVEKEIYKLMDIKLPNKIFI